MAEDGESPLSRWSRLKQRRAAASAGGRRRGGAVPVAFDESAARPPLAPGAEEREEGADNSPEAAAQAPPAADLPPVESLSKESDFTAFLADGVPEELKRAALRKLWLSDPAFAFLDGLDDYAEDFRIVEKMLATADELRKIGKGLEGAGEKAETAGAEAGDGEDDDEDEDGAGAEETAAAPDDDEAPGGPRKERE